MCRNNLLTAVSSYAQLALRERSGELLPEEQSALENLIETISHVSQGERRARNKTEEDMKIIKSVMEAAVGALEKAAAREGLETIKQAV